MDAQPSPGPHAAPADPAFDPGAVDRMGRPSAASWTLRLALLALLCALLAWWTPRFELGAGWVKPINLVLGVVVAAAATRGRTTLLAALVGLLVGNLLGELSARRAIAESLLIACQGALAVALLRRGDPGQMLLDDRARLIRWAAIAAPAVALVGAAYALVVAAVADGTAPWSRAAVVEAAGHFISDLGGVLVVSPILLAWLAQPPQPWRPRRRALALPMLLALAVLLPALSELAERDDDRRQSGFEHDAQARQQRLQQLLAQPALAVQGLQGLLTAGDDRLTGAVFTRQAEGWLRRIPGLTALAWLEAAPGGHELLVRQAQATDARALARLGNAAAISGPGQPATPGWWNAATLPSPALRALVAQAPRQPGLDELRAAPAGTPRTLALVAPAADGSSRQAVALIDLPALLAPALPDPRDPTWRVCITSDTRLPPAARAVPRPAGASAAAVPAGLPPGVDEPPQSAALLLAGSDSCDAEVRSKTVRGWPGHLVIGQQRLGLLVAEPVGADRRLLTPVWLAALPIVLGLSALSVLLLALTGRLRRVEGEVRERTQRLQREVDERRRAEALHADGERRFRAMFERLNVGLALLGPDGRVAAANPVLVAMTGLGAGALQERSIGELLLPPVAGDEAAAEALAGAGARRQRMLSADGRVLHLAINETAWSSPAGERLGTIVALHDMTPMLQLRQAEQQRTEAEVSERAQSSVLGGLGEALRQPLQSIVGMAQRLTRIGARPEELARLRDSGRKLLDVVDEATGLSGLEGGRLRLTPGRVSLAEALEEAQTALEPLAAERGVRVLASLSPQADWVHADPLRLRQIVHAMLQQAVQAGPRGGIVAVRAQPVDGAAFDEPAGRRHRHAVLEIEDEGAGMAPEAVAALFEPFGGAAAGRPANPDGSSPGSLLLPRRLAEHMGGTLVAESRLGGGTLRALTLPLDAESPAGGAGGAEPEAGPGATPLRSQVAIGHVLLIQADAHAAAAARAALEGHQGVTLEVAASAALGRRHAAEADLILLDLDLPEAPGLGLLRELLAQPALRGASVVVLSADGRPDLIDASIEAGARAFLVKPVDARQLREVVDQVLR